MNTVVKTAVEYVAKPLAVYITINTVLKMNEVRKTRKNSKLSNVVITPL